MKRLILMTAILALIVSTTALAQSDRGRAGESAEERHERQYRRIQNVLDTVTVDLDFEDAPLDEVIEYLSDRGELNIVIDPRVFRELDDEDLRVSLSLNNIKLGDAVAIICEYLDLQTAFKHGVMMIVLPDTAAGDVITRMYDIRDITFKLANFPGPEITLGNDDDEGGGLGVSFSGDDEEENEPMTADEIKDLIMDSVGGDSWDINDNATCTVFHGLLIVTQTRDVQQEVEALLAMLRSHR